MQPVRRNTLAVGIATLLSLSSGLTVAQSAYPAKAISIVVSYPAGGDTDAIARMFAEKLSKKLNQTVVVDNKPGASGTIGNTLVARAPADGYTLLFTPNTLTTAPMVLNLAPSASYDALNGFEAVIKVATQPLILVAHPSAGVKNVAEMIAAAKGGKALSYASPGAGSPMHVLAELLNRTAGVKIQHVPYRGVAPSVVDVVAGHVSTAWVTVGVVSQYMSQGKLLPVAIGDATRSSLAPNVPTLAESGYKEAVLGAWNGFFAPKGTPAAVVRLLNGHMNDILKEPEVVQKLATLGALPAGGAPSVLASTNADDFNAMSKIIKELGIKAE